MLYLVWISWMRRKKKKQHSEELSNACYLNWERFLNQIITQKAHQLTLEYRRTECIFWGGTDKYLH